MNPGVLECTHGRSSTRWLDDPASGLRDVRIVARGDDLVPDDDPVHSVRRLLLSAFHVPRRRRSSVHRLPSCRDEDRAGGGLTVAKVRRATDGSLFIFCPGCLHAHRYPPRVGGKGWAYNGDADRATFAPSMIIAVTRPDGTRYRCHSVVTDGKIFFCLDSSHLLRGQTFELEDF